MPLKPKTIARIGKRMFLIPFRTSGAAITPTAEPNQVGGLTATAVSSSQINLAWNADATAFPNGATYYDIERSVDGLGSWASIATVSIPTTTYSDTGLPASTTRYYRVTAYNKFGGGLASASANATTQAGSLSPSWSLDFSSGTPSGYTLTRASSGTYVDSSGYIASQASGTSGNSAARLTHNSSGTRLGLLVEESRTNLLQRSSEFFNAYWNNANNTTVSNQTSPASPNNATETARLRETTGAGIHNLGRNSVTVANSRYTFSAYLKKETRQYVGLSWVMVASGSTSYNATFDLNNGTFSAAITHAGTPNAEYGIQDAGNGWYRCWISVDTGASAEAYPFIYLTDRAGFSGTLGSFSQPSYTGSTSEGVYVWGLQIEQAGTTTSLIPTTTASVTRSADLAHVLDSSITSWGDPGALVIHFYPPGQAGTLLSTDDASTAQVGIEASSTTAARAFWSSGNTATGTIGTGVQKAVHYWNGSTSKFCINGGTVQSGTNNLTIANTDFVTLGAEATDSSGVPGTFSQYANCVIRKVEFYSGTLTDANLQTITT